MKKQFRITVSTLLLLALILGSFTFAAFGAEADSAFSLSKDFSSEAQGPVWRYQYVGHNLDNYEDLAAVSPDGRWRQSAVNTSLTWGAVGAGTISPATGEWLSTAVTFTAPKSGFVRISASKKITFVSTNTNDGAKIMVKKNADLIWPKYHPFDSDWKRLPNNLNALGGITFEPIGMYINAGDKLHFIANMLGVGASSDNLNWDPVVEYVKLGLSDYSLSMYKGAVYELKASDPGVLWRSDNESAATVDQSGKITAVGIGAATITASLGEAEAACTVDVSPAQVWSAPLTSVRLSGNTYRASVSVLNNKMALPYAPPVIFALYDIDGRLRASKLINDIVVEPENSELFFADFDLTGVEGAVIRSFVWDDLVRPMQLSQDFDQDIWSSYVSAVASSTDNNRLLGVNRGASRTYRVYVKPRFDFGTQTWRFWYSNIRDASDSTGEFHHENLLGGNWKITAAYIADGGTAPNGTVAEGTSVPVLYGGEASRGVLPGEQFWSDEVSFDLPEGHYLCFTWTVTGVDGGNVIPGGYESRLLSWSKTGDFSSQETSAGFAANGTGQGIFPNMFAVKKSVSKVIDFIGDSVTQGTGTQLGQEQYWVTKVSAGLGPDVRVWNHGLGWARTYDVSSDGAWLAKVKRSDEVNFVLGINDLGMWRTFEQWVLDMKKICSSVRAVNPNAKLTVFVPPSFDYAPAPLAEWRKIRSYLLTTKTDEWDYVFDPTPAIALPEPNEGMVVPEYKYSASDAHPNDLGCTAIANAYLEWYARRDI